MRAMAIWLACVTVAAAGSQGWLEDFDQAKKMAAEQNKTILADFSGSDWCGWCIRLDREVFSHEDFRAFAKDNLILFLADFPMRKSLEDRVKQQNEQLAEAYGVQAFPTVLLLDADGKVLARTGYRPGGAAPYVTHLKSLTIKKNTAQGAGATGETEG